LADTAAHTRAAVTSGSFHSDSTDSPAAETSTRRRTRVGNASASSAPTKPPIELATTTGASTPRAPHSASTARARPWMEMRPAGISEPPNPGRSGAITRWEPMNAGMLSSQFCHAPPSPWTNSRGGPSPPVSTTFIRRPRTVTGRVIAGQSTVIHVASSPSAYVWSGPGRTSA
jgi:hypothetical protein